MLITPSKTTKYKYEIIWFEERIFLMLRLLPWIGEWRSSQPCPSKKLYSAFHGPTLPSTLDLLVFFMIVFVARPPKPKSSDIFRTDRSHKLLLCRWVSFTMIRLSSPPPTPAPAPHHHCVRDRRSQLRFRRSLSKCWDW